MATLQTGSSSNGGCSLQTFALALKGCDNDGAEGSQMRSIFWFAQMLMVLGMFSMVGMMIPGRGGPRGGRAPTGGGARLPRGSAGRKGTGKGRGRTTTATVDLDPVQQGSRSRTTSTDNFVGQTELSREQIKQLGVMFVMASYEFWTNSNGEDHDGVLRTMNQIRALYLHPSDKERE